MGLGQALVSDGVQLATAAVNTWLNQIQLAHNADTATTQIVNELEPLLRQNVAAYLSGPGTCEDQAAAMSAYLTAYNWLISPAGCGNGAYGSAGNRCISDRFGPDGPTDTSNTKWPWANYYYYPILNDPRSAGCAAETAASNPNAAQQSAIQNIVNLASGSNLQTTPGMYSAAGSPATSTFTPTGSIFGIPTGYLLLGGAALLLLLVME